MLSVAESMGSMESGAVVGEGKGAAVELEKEEGVEEEEARETGRVPEGESAEAWFAGLFCGAGRSGYEALLDEFAWLGSRWEAGLSRWEVGFLRPRSNARTIQAAHFAVNAQRVQGWAGREYLCCEGPNLSSTYDFWEMVWQEDVAALLMLNTPFEERLFPKTYNPAHETIQYWPLRGGTSLSFAPWKVTCSRSVLKARPSDLEPRELGDPDVVYRLSELWLEWKNPVVRSPPRRLLHICYYRWPDGEIPLGPPDEPLNYEASGRGLVELLREELGAVEGRLLVHCHAGIGRTGVAVALDMAAQRLLHTHRADVANTLRFIRRQRPKSVMNVWQYALVNLALASLALSAGLVGPHPALFAVPPRPLPAIPGQPSPLPHLASSIAHTASSHQLLAHAWAQLAADFNDPL